MKSPDIDTPASVDAETNQTKNGFLALVSKMIFEDKLPVRFMYKTVPEHLNDTGWRMFSGYETPEYLEDEVTNLIPVDVEQMVKLDPSMTELVEYNAGTVWERVPDSDGWERVHDYRIPSAFTEVNITNDVDKFSAE